MIALFWLFYVAALVLLFFGKFALVLLFLSGIVVLILADLVKGWLK